MYGNTLKVKHNFSRFPTSIKKLFLNACTTYLEHSNVIDLHPRCVRPEHIDLRNVDLDAALGSQIVDTCDDLIGHPVKAALFIDDAVRRREDETVGDDGTTAGAVAIGLQRDLVLELSRGGVVATDDAVRLAVYRLACKCTEIREMCIQI